MTAIDTLNKMLRTGCFDKVSFDGILKEYPRMPFIPIYIPKENKIFRSSSNDNKMFHEDVARLNYPPRKELAHLSRASMEGQQMFYACVFNSFEIEDREYSLPPRVVSAFETSHLFKDFDQSGKMFTTQSLWLSSRPLHLLMLPNTKVWNKPSRELKMVQEFVKTDEEFVNGYTKEEYQLGEFFGNLFAENAYSCLYEITSGITDYLIFRSKYADDFDGIAYPSVKAEGNGFNICLKISVVDECISFQDATVTMIVKEAKEITMFQIANAVQLSEGKLKWTPTEYGLKLLVGCYGPRVLLDPRVIEVKKRC